VASHSRHVILYMAEVTVAYRKGTGHLQYSPKRAHETGPVRPEEYVAST